MFPIDRVYRKGPYRVYGLEIQIPLPVCSNRVFPHRYFPSFVFWTPVFPPLDLLLSSGRIHDNVHFGIFFRNIEICEIT